MNVLDENILESQRQLLRGWRISVRQIGVELGRKGMADEEILPFLLTVHRPTFFTRDLGLAGHQFCHTRYSLVILAVGQYEAAHFIRHFLRHPACNSQAKRMGAVIRIMPNSLLVWRLHAEQIALLTPPPALKRPRPKKRPDFAARLKRIYGEKVLRGDVIVEERESRSY